MTLAMSTGLKSFWRVQERPRTPACNIGFDFLLASRILESVEMKILKGLIVINAGHAQLFFGARLTTIEDNEDEKLARVVAKEWMERNLSELLRVLFDKACDSRTLVFSIYKAFKGILDSQIR